MDICMLSFSGTFSVYNVYLGGAPIDGLDTRSCVIETPTRDGHFRAVRPVANPNELNSVGAVG